MSAPEKKEAPSFVRRDALIENEVNVRKMWEDAKVYEQDAPQNSTDKQKFMCTFPYPYMNGVLHLGHAFSLSKAEFAARYQRLRGKQVLFPFGFHCTGMPIAACADRLKREVAMYGNPPVFPVPVVEAEEGGDDDKENVKEEPKAKAEVKEAVAKKKGGKSKVGAKASKQAFQWNIMKEMGVPEEEISKFQDPLHWLSYFPPIGREDLKLFGLAADFRRSFITTDVNPYYDAFIRWQFNTLQRKQKLMFGTRLSIYSTVDGQPCADHDRASGEGVNPFEYTLIKIRLLKPYPKSLEAVVTDDMTVFLPAATLRPETMYGQTNCFVLPDGEYGVYKVNKTDVFICTERSANNMCHQNIMAWGFGKLNKLTSVMGTELLGCAVKAPHCSYEKVYVLPLLTISMVKGTGIVTSVPSDAPDDYAALMDLKTKPKLREKYNITDEMVLPFEVVPIINIPGLGNQAAADLCVEMKVASQNDRAKLDIIKDKTYLQGFNFGIMLVGDHKDKLVSVAKPLIKQEMIDRGDAVIYSEPESVIMSRSGGECVVALTAQWYLNYGEDKWKALIKDHVDNVLQTFNPRCKDAFDIVVRDLHEWGCSRSFGLGSRLPADPKFVIESLSDSTIYMAYYTIAHFLQTGPLDGSQAGRANAPADKFTDDVFNYVFLNKEFPTYPSGCDIPQAVLDEMKNEFEYWYPMDLRVSGKDLIQNHLTMSLYNHSAVWESQPELWPRGFFTNGHVLIDTKKMSKSTGNFMTLRDAIKKYGADAVRFALCDAGDSLEDANFGSDIANQAILRLTKESTWAEETVAEMKSLRPADSELTFWDQVFMNELNFNVQKATEEFDNMKFMSALKYGVYDMLNIRDTYRVSCSETGVPMHTKCIERFFECFYVMISPICPFWAQQMWTTIGNKGLIVDAKWPAAQPVDALLALKVSYLRELASNCKGSQAKAQIMIAKRTKVPPAQVVLKELNLTVAVNLPAWQKQVLDLMTSMYEEGGKVLPENRLFVDACKKIFTSHPDKKMMKNSMTFGGQIRNDFELRGEAALASSMPFDEVAFVKEHTTWFTRGLNVTTVITTLDYNTDPDNQSGASPGKPAIMYA